jgi:hypothetical protein
MKTRLNKEECGKANERARKSGNIVLGGDGPKIMMNEPNDLRKTKQSYGREKMFVKRDFALCVAFTPVPSGEKVRRTSTSRDCFKQSNRGLWSFESSRSIERDGVQHLIWMETNEENANCDEIQCTRNANAGRVKKRIRWDEVKGERD